ncbi:unnamed protein product [Lasius platythorax]|uniref:Uncharacterized protein n=1 Tax=Lasius platythorax TaxID=488582 RepID=A0AAV2NGR3_9HYME
MKQYQSLWIPTQISNKTPNYFRKIHFYEDPSIADSTPFTTAPSTPNQSGSLTPSTPERSRSPARPAALLVEQGSPKQPGRSPPLRKSTRTRRPPQRYSP